MIFEKISLRRHVHDPSELPDYGGNPNVAKATAMCVLFICSMTVGCLPLMLRRWLIKDEAAVGRPEKNSRLVNMLLAFGGGVLLCTVFLHLIPSVSETFEKADIVPSINISLAELLTCTGFFIMHFVEEAVRLYLIRKEERAYARGIHTPGDVSRASSMALDKIQTVQKHSHLLANADSTIKALRGLLIVLALSVHELFEGLAVGLQYKAGTVWYMFGAVSAHKMVIAFCIGVELITTISKVFLIVIYIFTFAVVSPLGIGIGIGISNMKSSTGRTASIYLQGVASGTLLYVVFFEILQNERRSGLLQCLATFIGFGFMLGITILVH